MEQQDKNKQESEELIISFDEYEMLNWLLKIVVWLGVTVLIYVISTAFNDSSNKCECINTHSREHKSVSSVFPDNHYYFFVRT